MKLSRLKSFKKHIGSTTVDPHMSGPTSFRPFSVHKWHVFIWYQCFPDVFLSITTNDTFRNCTPQRKPVFCGLHKLYYYFFFILRKLETLEPQNQIFQTEYSFGFRMLEEHSSAMLRMFGS